MPKVVVSVDGVVIKELQLTKDRTTIGRRPYNDIVIDNLAVSGEHAVLKLASRQVSVEDLGSTNGTFLNGQQVRAAPVGIEDVVEVGRYQLRVVDERTAVTAALNDLASTVFSLSKPGASGFSDSGSLELASAVVRVLDGAGAGRELPLTKVVTTLGKPGVIVAAITRKRRGFAIAHVDGDQRGEVNGTAIGDHPVDLEHGDIIRLADIRMEFQLG